jgi:Ca2+-transporting ATPase
MSLESGSTPFLASNSLTTASCPIAAALLSINDSTGDERASSFFDSFRKLSVSFKNLLIQSIAINSTAFEGEENGQRAFIGSKTETALLSLARDHLGMCAVAEERAGTEVVQLIPFDSSRKCMGASDFGIAFDSHRFDLVDSNLKIRLLLRVLRHVLVHSRQ